MDIFLANVVGLWEFLWPIISTIVAIIGGGWALIKAWPTLRRAFDVSDTVATLPELIGGLKKDVAAIKTQTDSLEEKSDRKEQKLGAIEGDLAKLVQRYDEHLEENKLIAEEWLQWRSMQDTMFNELTHNGGSSLKDAIARLELKVNGYEQLPGETLEAAAARLRYSQSSQTGEISAVDSPE